MYKNKKILAIIPARQGSKGLPGKNWKKINKKPLVQWTIEQAKHSSFIDDIVISTDSPSVWNIAKKHINKRIKIHKRPKVLSSDKVPIFPVIEATLEKYDNNHDYILLLQPTSPLREDQDIDNFITNLIDRDYYKSCISMCKVETWSSPDSCFLIKENNEIDKFNKGLLNTKRRQDIKSAYYFPNGAMFMAEKYNFLLTKTFYQNKTLGFKMKKWQRFDIDDIDDFIVVEALLKKREENEKKI